MIAIGMPIVFALGFSPMVGFLIAEKPVFLNCLAFADIISWRFVFFNRRNHRTL